jgi:RNA polymerase sigma-70 factor (ECF subfamily)
MPLVMAAARLRARNDAGLTQASKRGDISAFEEIYAAHAGRMKSIAFHLLQDRADAEDAVQEAFLKIYRGAATIQFDSGLAPWIYRILINCCYDAGRKRKRQAEAPLAVEPAISSNVPLQVAIRSALDRIHPQYRMVFWLFEVEGFRHSEVAAILEIPEGTSKKWLFEAKRELQRLLKEARA